MELGRRDNFRGQDLNRGEFFADSAAKDPIYEVSINLLRLFAADLSMQPGLRHAPIAFDGGGRNAQYLCGLFDVKSAKEAHLYDLTLLRINLRQPAQSFIKSNQIDAATFCDRRLFVERHPQVTAAAFGAMFRPRVIDQNPSHQLRRDTKELRAVLPP